MEHRLGQLELKLAEQEQVNAGLRDDIKSLKEIQHGNRTEYLQGFEHYEQKKKKFSGLLAEANTSISALQDQKELLASKEELQSLSHRLDDLKTLVDRNAAGMHASGSPQAPDLMVFSPERSLISFGETAASPANPPAGHETRSEPQPLQGHPNRITSPLLDVSNAEGAQSPRHSLEDVPSAESSVTERDPSPFVRITPPTAHTTKKVRFAPSAQIVDSLPSDSGSDDPLAPNATLRRNNSRNKKMNTTSTSEDSPLVTAKSTKSSRRKPAAALKPSSSKPTGVLAQFKDGRLNSDSEDEDRTSLQLQPQTPASESQDKEAAIDLAERAVTSLVGAEIGGAATGIRRSGRVPKQKDFGDVEVHGWKMKRVRRS